MRKKTMMGLFSAAIILTVVCCFFGCGEDKGETVTATVTTDRKSVV